MLAFPVEILKHLDEGLYLFVPEIFAKDCNKDCSKDCPAATQETLAYLFTWTPWSTFVRPTRNSPYCSLYRYMVELASDIVHVFDAKAIEKFDTASRPFGRTQRKQFANFKLVGKTEQETDIHFDGTEPAPVGMDIDLDSGPQIKVALQPVTSACCMLKMASLPPQRMRMRDDRVCYIQDLGGLFQELMLHHSVTFERYGFDNFCACRVQSSSLQNQAIGNF